MTTVTTRIHPILVAEGTLVAYPDSDARHHIIAIDGAWLDEIILDHFASLVEPHVYDGVVDGEHINGVRVTVEVVVHGNEDARQSEEIVADYLAAIPKHKRALLVDEDDIRWYVGWIARSRSVNIAALARDRGDTYAFAYRLLRHIAAAFLAERNRGRVLPYDAVSFLAHYRGGRLLW